MRPRQKQEENKTLLSYFRAKRGWMNLIVDDDFHGTTWGFRAFMLVR
jgi:hypothetical protein